MTVLATFLAAAALAAQPNVIFLSVDTLRADHLGCYGYPHNTSPNLDVMAEDAIVFENVVCEVPLTGPSFASMLTSRYPRLTGVTRNGIQLSDTIPTVAEQFSAAGYYTMCVQSNWTVKGEISGLDRGFDVYEDGFRKKRWGFLKSERTGDEVTKIALRLLKKWDRSQPLFAWIHYSDPHAPYKMHKRFKPSDSDDHPHPKGNVAPKYDSEIAFTDFHIARLLDALPKENTVVLFVGDHGESLYEHDYLGHGRYVYQTNMRIPLMIWGTGIEPRRTGVPARGVDVGTTLLALANLPAPPGMLGTNLLERSVSDDRIRVVETYGGAVLNVPGIESIMENQGPQWQTVISGSWKLIAGKDNYKLFNLSKDPLETTDLALRFPTRTDELAQLVVEWNQTTETIAGEAAELSIEDREALEALGYID